MSLAAVPRSAGDAVSAGVTLGEEVRSLDTAVWNTFHASNGDHWFASRERGAYRHDGATLTRYTMKDGLPNDDIGGIQEDDAGNLYFTTSAFDERTRSSRLAIARFDGTSFTTIVPADQAAAEPLWRVDPSDLWFGAEQDSGAVLRFDGETWHRLVLPSTPEGDAFLAAHPRSLYPTITYSPYDVFRIFEDSRGHVWFCTALLGACRYDGESFTWIPESELGNGSFGTRSIVEDAAGRFWFGDTLHCYGIDTSDSHVPSFRRLEGLRDERDPSAPAIEGILSAVLDANGATWMATYGDGVWRLDGDELVHFPVEVDGSAVNLFSIRADREGVLWLGTQSAGVFRFDGRRFVPFVP